MSPLDNRLCLEMNGVCSGMDVCPDGHYVKGLCSDTGQVCCLSQSGNQTIEGMYSYSNDSYVKYSFVHCQTNRTILPPP